MTVKRRTTKESHTDIDARFVEVMRQLRHRTTLPAIYTSIHIVDGHQLTITQINALRTLAREKAWRMTEIAAELGIDHTTASRTFAPLVRLGLAERAKDPSDGRTVLIRATAKGQEQTRIIARRTLGLTRAVLGKMAPERRLLLTELLEEYVSAVKSVIGRASG